MNECTYKNYDELPLMLNAVPGRMNWFTVRTSLR